MSRAFNWFVFSLFPLAALLVAYQPDSRKAQELGWNQVGALAAICAGLVFLGMRLKRRSQA